MQAVGTEGQYRVLEVKFFSSVKQVLLCFAIFTIDNRGLTPGVPTATVDAAVGTEGQTAVDVSGRHRRSAPRYKKQDLLFSVKQVLLCFLQLLQMITAV